DQMESYLEQNRTIAASCEVELADNRLTLLFAENCCFVFFQIVQVYFCLNAVIHQNMIQIFVILGLNIACSLYGIAQQYEVESGLNVIMFSCPGVYTFSPNYESFEYPNMIISSLFAFVNLILAWRLFLLYEKQMYEKANIEINKQGRFHENAHFCYDAKVGYILDHRKCCINGCNNPVSWATINNFIRKWKIGLYIFLALWVFFVADFAFLIKDASSAASSGWYFWLST
ncbi:3508_t:CDS:2, partial [Racocetra persica]